MVRRTKPSGESVAINVRTNVGRDVGTHEVGLAQITVSASIIVMQKVRGDVMTTSNYRKSARLLGDQKRIRVGAGKEIGNIGGRIGQNIGTGNAGYRIENATLKTFPLGGKRLRNTIMAYACCILRNGNRPVGHHKRIRHFRLFRPVGHHKRIRLSGPFFKAFVALC